MFTKKRHLEETIETQGKQIKARDKFIDGQRAEIHAWQNENKKLQQLRDTLLPKLMNGEIDLDNIEI